MSIGSDQAVRELSLVRRDDKRFHCELSSFQIQKDIDYLVFIFLSDFRSPLSLSFSLLLSLFHSLVSSLVKGVPDRFCLYLRLRAAAVDKHGRSLRVSRQIVAAKCGEIEERGREKAVST